VAGACGPEQENPAGGRRERNTRRNRDAILAAAREVFRERGYGASSVRDIIRRTPLATGTFYNYFPDKESVLRMLIEDFQRELRQRVHRARVQASSLEELLFSAFRCCFEYFARERLLLDLMLRNAGEIQQLTSVAALEPAIEELAADLRQAPGHERIAPQDVEALAASMVAVAGELAFRLAREEPPDVDGAARFATELFLGGIERLAHSRRRPG